MEVHFTPEVQAQLDEFALASGRASEELVQDAVTGLLDDMGHTREMLDRRYDEMKSGGVQMIDGRAFFEELRRREDELLVKSKAG